MEKEDKLKIKRELRTKGYSGKTIDYQQLVELYQEYKQQMSEEEFAEEILELSYANYYSCKTGRNRVRVLKSIEQLSNEEKNAIREKLIAKGYKSKSISYDEFKEIHMRYGKSLHEKDFAIEILGASSASFRNCKYINQNMKILKRDFQDILPETKKSIIEELEEKGYTGKLISYEELQQLHNEFGNGLSEEEFARTILDIRYDNYNSCRNRNTRVKILRNLALEKELEEKKEEKTQEEPASLSEKEIWHIIKKIQNTGFIGIRINYDDLEYLHNKYAPQMSEKDFAKEVLGISYVTYKNCKYKNAKPKTRNGMVLKIVEERTGRNLRSGEGYHFEELFEGDSVKEKNNDNSQNQSEPSRDEEER